MSNDSEDEETAPDAGADEAAETAAEQSDEAGEAATEQPETEEEDTELQEDDVILLDYTARTVEDDRLVDTTDPEVAEQEDVDADQEFAPRTIVLGRGHIFPSVESDVIGATVGDTGSVTVSATEAFGPYDEEEVRTISTDKIPEDDRYPGAQVRIDGDEGFVETIIGGRARVDFNHPLAGEDIEYEYEVVDVVEDRQQKASGLLKLFLDLDLNVWFQTDTIEEEQLVESDEVDDESVDEVDDESVDEVDDESVDEVDDESVDEVDDESVDEVDDESVDEADDESVDEADDESAGDEEPPEPLFETVEIEKESLYIEATPQLTMNQQWMMQKQQIGEDLMELLEVDRIVVQDIIDGSGMGMPGMMGGMGGGMGGGDIEDALEDADIDADELADELE